MAKAKAKAKAKVKAKVKTISLPAGYKALERHPSWDFEKNPVIEGVRGKTFTKTGKYGKQRYCTIDDATLSLVTVWESGMLSDFFDQTSENDSVRIEYLGLGQAKKDQKPPRLFSVGVKG
jgi:hypothetical protein